MTNRLTTHLMKRFGEAKPSVQVLGEITEIAGDKDGDKGGNFILKIRSLQNNRNQLKLIQVKRPALFSLTNNMSFFIRVEALLN